MNATTTRRLMVENRLRDRIKRRVLEQAVRKRMLAEQAGACDCPRCQLVRSLQAAGGTVFRLGDAMPQQPADDTPKH